MGRHPTEEPRDDYTARPTHVAAQTDTTSGVEEGLSLDPEDLGAQFLCWAVEQGDSEWPPPSAWDEGYQDDTPPLVDALDLDGGDERIRSLAWERALRRALMREAPLAPKATELAGAPAERPSPEPASYRWDELDLTDAAIHEASLFDHEGRELGETEPPSALRTDDTHTHLKPRGGHLPERHTARASPSAHSGKTFR